MSKSQRQSLPAPPVSFTEIWDKAKWHFESDQFPADLTPTDGAAHIVAALAFLNDKGMLTADGREELRGDVLSMALLGEHVRASARAFLDEEYGSFLKAVDYCSPPPTDRLEAGWERYTQRFDVRKRPRANPYQALLLEYGVSSLEDLLTTVRARSGMVGGDLLSELDSARSLMAPEEQRFLDAVRVALGPNMPADGESFGDPASLLQAVHFIPELQRRFATAAMLFRRLRECDDGPPLWERLADAVNAGYGTASASADAWWALDSSDRKLLTDTVNRLFLHGVEHRNHATYNSAICAMRTVGDETSATLLESIPCVDFDWTIESTVEGRTIVEPWSAHIRRNVHEAIRLRNERRSAAPRPG